MAFEFRLNTLAFGQPLRTGVHGADATAASASQYPRIRAASSDPALNFPISEITQSQYPRIRAASSDGLG